LHVGAALNRLLCMFRAEVWDKKMVADSYSAAALIGEGNAKQQRTKARDNSESCLFSVLQLQKRSWTDMTSDTLDIGVW